MRRAVVIGAGLGGLAAAVDLACAGWQVTVCERAQAPGGKVRTIEVGGRPIDAGPTVFTLREVFADLFRDAGARLEDRLELIEADVLARHAWRDGSQLDLYADLERSTRAIDSFAGRAAAAQFRDFCQRSAGVYAALRDPFMRAERPSPAQLVARLGMRGIQTMTGTPPWRSLWRVLGNQFDDVRLRQLFARYATYVGSSPLSAPATLMLIAHVEQAGVWLVRGGMHRVARSLESLARERGATFRYRTPVAHLQVHSGRVDGVTLESGETLPADAVVFNGDVSALGAGALGERARTAAIATPPRRRGLSAITWCMSAPTSGFSLEHHNVYFGDDYPGEFRAIFDERRVTEDPTVYVCAQDRGAAANGPVAPGQAERLLVLVNAPADPDAIDEQRLAIIEQRSFSLMQTCGLNVTRSPGNASVMVPRDFAELFPYSGGSLYGRANHGALGSFQRAGSRSGLRGLYLAGGTVHPGPGIPMVTLSGRLAAASVLADQA